MSDPNRYRKRPVVIEAMGPITHDNAGRIADWCGGWRDIDRASRAPSVIIRTLEGDMRASEGDFVIRGVQGEFYPCKPDIFDQTYELVEEA